MILFRHVKVKAHNISFYGLLLNKWWVERSYLIFVTSINSGASVKKLTERNFFHNLREKDS